MSFQYHIICNIVSSNSFYFLFSFSLSNNYIQNRFVSFVLPKMVTLTLLTLTIDRMIKPLTKKLLRPVGSERLFFVVGRKHGFCFHKTVTTTIKQFPLIPKWTSSVILSEDQCTSANPAPTHRSDVQLSCNHSENSFSSHLKIFSPACFSE